RIALRDGILVCTLVVLPPFAILEVAERDFPMPLRIFEPPLETLLLLVLTDVQEKFYDHDLVIRQMPLEIVDLVVPSLPYANGNQLVDPYDYHVLVMGSV